MAERPNPYMYDKDRLILIQEVVEESREEILLLRQDVDEILEYIRAKKKAEEEAVEMLMRGIRN